MRLGIFMLAIGVLLTTLALYVLPREYDLYLGVPGAGLAFIGLLATGKSADEWFQERK